MLQHGQGVEQLDVFGSFSAPIIPKKGEKAMTNNSERMAAALELLRFKAARQMCEGKRTCFLNEEDIQEILYVAGMQIDKELEVM